MKSKKKLKTKFPTGLKWVVAYLIFNAFGILFILIFGNFLEINYNIFQLLPQLLAYSILAFGIVKLNNFARIGTMIFLVLLFAVRIYFKYYRSILLPVIFAGLVIYYLAKPEVEQLFIKKAIVPKRS